MRPPAVVIPVWLDTPYRRADTGQIEVGGRAFVDALIGYEGEEIPTAFEIDTGTARTSLGAADALDLLGDAYQEIDFAADSARTVVYGVAGELRCVARDAHFSFRVEDGSRFELVAPILIPEITYTPAGRRQPASPSLLGRDILGRGALTLAWRLPAQLHFSSLPPTQSALR